MVEPAGTSAAPPGEFDVVRGGWTRRGRWRHRLRRRPLIQADAMDCGPACVAMLAAHYGVEADLNHLRRLLRPDQGTDLARLSDGLEHLGFETFAFELEPHELAEAREPFITALGPHFVVVWGASRDGVELADPAVGARRVPRAEFEATWPRICLFARPTAAAVPAATERLRAGPLLRRHAGVLTLLLMLSLLGAAAALGATYLTKMLFDDVVPAKDFGLLKLVALALAAVVVGSQVVATIRDFVIIIVGSRLHVQLSIDLYRHFLSVPYLDLARKVSGDVLGRMHDVATLRTFIIEQFLEIVVNTLFFLVALGFIAMVSLKIAAIAVATGLVSVAMSLASSRLLYKRNQEMFVQSAIGDQMIIEQTRNFLALKCFGAEPWAAATWLRQLQRNARLLIDFFRRVKVLDLLVEAAGAVGTGAVALYGAVLVMRGELTVGYLVAIGTLYAMVVSPLEKLADVVAGLQGVRASRHRIGEVLALPAETGGSVTAVRDGRVELERVSFAYVPYDDGNDVLRDVSATIADGEIVGLVGPSGAGKTTFCLLLNRVLDDYRGTIRIGGVDTRELALPALRRLVGVVTQDPCLLTLSILDNIALGDERPDRERVRWAARLAQAADFVEALPGGYDFSLGQGGLGLSSGQRQRLAIARALYHDPRVLILDEVTSSLDRETERRLLAGLAPVLAGRTVIVVSHRLSALRLASRVLMLDEGRLQADGTLAALSAQDPTFRRLMLDDLSE